MSDEVTRIVSVTIEVGEKETYNMKTIAKSHFEETGSLTEREVARLVRSLGQKAITRVEDLLGVLVIAVEEEG